MIRLLKKEFALSFHPTSAIFLLCTLLVFVPNYPYEVLFFFSCLGVFFTCLTARENSDLVFTCALPVAKRDAVKARMSMVGLFQIATIVLSAILACVKSEVLPMPNAAGMDANAAFVGMGAAILGVFNVIFFPMYYKKPNKVGVPFVIAALTVFAIIIVEIVLCYAVPFVRESVDSLASDGLVYRIAVCAAGIGIYFGLSLLAYFVSAKRISHVDL